MTNTTITPAKVYASVKEAVQAGATVTAEDLEAANAYAKRVKKGQIKGATVTAAKKARKTKLAGVKCSGSEKYPNCDRDAIVTAHTEDGDKPSCMREYIGHYRTDKANRERANKASRDYAARQRAKKAAEAKKA